MAQVARTVTFMQYVVEMGVAITTGFTATRHWEDLESALQPSK